MMNMESAFLCDTQIKRYADSEVFRMIHPFVGELVRQDEDGKGVISFGLSSFGYDARLGRKFKVFSNLSHALVDPKNFDPDAFVELEGDTCIIPPNSFLLGATIERFRIPTNIFCLCIGKSTYARCGLIVNVTPLEPGWEGYVTVEISNTTPLPAKVYAGEGIMQVLFYWSLVTPSTSYDSRKGKYQNQPAVPVNPTVEGSHEHQEKTARSLGGGRAQKDELPGPVSGTGAVYDQG